MNKQITSDVRALRRAKKSLNFWYKVLLDTEMMNDLSHRQEFQQIITTVDDNYKKRKKES